MSNKTVNILIVGVGGQGTILASRILAFVAQKIAADVKVSEIHGMSQRGGSVVTQVRYGDKVYAPVIAEGTADIIIGFEKLEALRWAKYLKKGGKMVVNNQEIDPMPVIMGMVDYPQEIEASFAGEELIEVPAIDIAREEGNQKATNVVLLGALAKNLGHESDIWEEALKSTVPQKFLDLNLRAFRRGYGYQE